ncbi:hypothetical protein ACFRNJ_47860 [Streptomyces sp. NPDC056721]|uniref:hypothetical protein n=1 Tax=Streptomyces sp. NPDC056721 TaxID=3345923 RepID=UPI0036B442CE
MKSPDRLIGRIDPPSLLPPPPLQSPPVMVVGSFAVTVSWFATSVKVAVLVTVQGASVATKTLALYVRLGVSGVDSHCEGSRSAQAHDCGERGHLPLQLVQRHV